MISFEETYKIKFPLHYSAINIFEQGYNKYNKISYGQVFKNVNFSWDNYWNNLYIILFLKFITVNFEIIFYSRNKAHYIA